MSETLWRHISSNTMKQEPFTNPTLLENVNKNTELDAILEKMMKLNSEKKGFTKLPFLESIYDDSTSQQIDHKKRDAQNVNGDEKDDDDDDDENSLKEGFSSKDFADKELEKQLKDVGFLDDRGLHIGSTESKGDRWCDKNSDKTMKNINVTETIMYYIGLLPRFAFIPFYLGEWIIKKMVIIFTNIITISGKSVSVAEQKMIINEFYKSINFFIILVITYNWFFVLFYVEDDRFIEVPAYDTNWLNNNSSIARFIFEYSLLPITFMHTLFTSRKIGTSFFYYIYNISQKPFFQWWILFFIVYFFLYPIDQGGWFKKYIFSCGKGKEVGDGFVMSILYISIFKPLSFIKSFIDIFNVTPPKSIEEEREEEKYKDSYLWHISNFLKWGLRVGITYSLYPFTLFLMFAYFVLHSLFSVKLYEDKYAGFMEIIMNILGSLNPFSDVSPIYRKMNQFMKGNDEGMDDDEVQNSSEESKCKPNKNKISPMMIKLMNIILLFVFSRGISENIYNFSTLKNEALKGTLTGLSGLALLIFGVLLYGESNTIIDEDYEDFSDPLTMFVDAEEDDDEMVKQQHIKKILDSLEKSESMNSSGSEPNNTNESEKSTK